MEDLKKLDRLEPWLDDGNIVLSVQGKHFRVHRGILCSYSQIFEDMLSIPHSDDVEKEVIDGCPVVHLHDEAADVQIILKAFYDRSYVFCHDTPMPLSVLAAFLRLGKKYAIRRLFEEAKSRLSFDSPITALNTVSATTHCNAALFPRISGNDKYNFRVMNVASEVGLLSPVIVAIVRCCVACPVSHIIGGYDDSDVDDGVTSGSSQCRCTLSAANQRYCFLAQRCIASIERELVVSIAEEPISSCWHNFYASGKKVCTSALIPSILRDLRCPFTVWTSSWENSLCNGCKMKLKRRYEDTRTRLWNKLPVNMGLGGWEDLDKEAEFS